MGKNVFIFQELLILLNQKVNPDREVSEKWWGCQVSSKNVHLCGFDMGFT